MLRLLDRYIAGKFVRTFLFTVLIFSMISLIIDFSEKIERFIESGITRSQVVFEYFPTFLVFILGLLWPMITLISVVFFTGRLAGNSEILSILNAGVSFRRLLRPYLLVSGVLTLIYLFGAHYVIPKSNFHRLGIEREYFGGDKDEGENQNVHFMVAPNTVAFFRIYRKNDSTASDLRLEQYVDHELKSVLKARNAKYLGGKPHKWEIRNYTIRSFSEEFEQEFEQNTRSPLDTLIDVGPEDFIDYEEQQFSMTSSELLAYIDQQKRRGAGNVRKYQVEWARRLSEPFTILILTLIGVAVAGRKTRGGIGIQLAAGMFIGALFVFMSRFISIISLSSPIPPIITMWIPNICFALAAFWLIGRAQK
ncbi:MAG: LptF/LptG family permease [Bacteroidota bacterium]